VITSLFDVVAPVALASDAGHGVPLGHQLRASVLAVRAGGQLGLPEADLRGCFDATLLRWIGCTATAPVLSAWFGDEVGAHMRALRFATPVDPLLEILRHAGAERPAWERLQTIVAALGAGPGAVFGAACEVGQALARRLGYADDVGASLAVAFERWDGRGWPGELRGDAIPVAARIAAVADDAQTYGENLGVAAAVDVVRKRRGRHHDPACADAVLTVLDESWDELQQGQSWDLAMRCEPGGPRRVDGADVDSGLEVVADFADLKTPMTSGHSRAVAALADAAAQLFQLAPADRVCVRRAALVHGLGRLTVSNAIWQKPGPLNASEFEQVRLCPYWTERFFAAAGSLAAVGALASLCRERVDGSGYHRGLRASSIPAGARILAAADTYQALVEPRAHREANDPDRASTIMRHEVRAGRLDGDSVDAVLTAAGHRRRRRPERPSGLTTREIEVLGLLSIGLANKEIAQRLVVSPRTVGHHVAAIYRKLGVTNRAAATLFAIEHDLVDRGR
jgi:HD-GYP domain-containing protein (c-di-GMP phosphodiesterase class II)